MNVKQNHDIYIIFHHVMFSTVYNRSMCMLCSDIAKGCVQDRVGGPGDCVGGAGKPGGVCRHP